MNSATLFAGTEGWTTSTLGIKTTWAMKVKSLTVSYGSFSTRLALIVWSIAPMSSGVAIGWRARHHLGADHATAGHGAFRAGNAGLRVYLEIVVC